VDPTTPFTDLDARATCSDPLFARFMGMSMTGENLVNSVVAITYLTLLHLPYLMYLFYFPSSPADTYKVGLMRLAGCT
jgi:hypothetical protein